MVGLQLYLPNVVERYPGCHVVVLFSRLHQFVSIQHNILIVFPWSRAPGLRTCMLLFVEFNQVVTEAGFRPRWRPVTYDFPTHPWRPRCDPDLTAQPTVTPNTPQQIHLERHFEAIQGFLVATRTGVTNSRY